MIDIFPRSEAEWFRSTQKTASLSEWKFEIVMHLPRWKARRKEVYIILHATETIQRRSGGAAIVTKSTVRLSYCDVEEECELLHSIHYDFDKIVEKHPLFHAQVTNEAPSLPDVAQQELEIILPKPRSPLFKFARIPTSDMTLPSALLCLAADHCGDQEAFDAFREKVMSLREKMHYADASMITNHVSGSKLPILCSSVWFGKSPE
jgi:hypothetical protein